jgi:Flp pilus assembly protein TadD
MATSLSQLRAMSVGELLDTTFRLYRRNFLLFIGLVAVIQVPLTLLGVAFEATYSPTVSETQDYYYYTDEQAWFVIGQFIMALLNFLAVQGLMTGAMARAIHDRYLGQPRGLVDTYRALGWGWLRLVAALVVMGLLDVGVFMLLFVPAVLGTEAFLCLFCLGGIAAFILLTYLNVPIMSLLAPVIIIENKGVFAGLRRSFDLGRRRFWRVFGINFLLWLLTMVITMPLSLFFNVIPFFWEPGALLMTIIASSINMVVTLLVRPIWVCGLTLLYFDLRVRLEGFDLELMAAQMDAEAAPAPAQARADLEARQRLERAYAFEEMGNFESALLQCEAAIRLAPNLAEAHNLHGILLEELGRGEEAVAAYRDAVHLAPAFVEARENLQEAQQAGEESVPLGLSAQARQHLEQAYAWEERDELENALRECEAAIRLAPDWAEAHNLHGILLEALGQTREAVTAYGEAVRLDPTFLEARENLQEAEAELREKGRLG